MSLIYSFKSNYKIGFYNKIIILFAFVAFASIKAQTYVTDSDDLSDFVDAASPGDVFIVTNGTYSDFDPSFEAIGTSENPITIKAETVGGVTLTGESSFVFNKSAHIILEGFVFNCTGNDTMVKLNGCNNIRITRNDFKTTTTESVKWVYIGGVWDDDTAPYQYLSHNNRIDHNNFRDKTTPGHYITVDGTNQELQSQFDRIDHNYFYNNGPRAVNEQESIRIGWSEMSMSSGYTIVEYNLFEDCDGDPEIVSVKSCDNIIRHNTFLKSYGTLSLRHGNRNRVEGNYFFGGNKANGTSGTSTLYTGGIRIYGKDHVIINNYFEGLEGTKWDAPITLTQGDAIDGNSTNLTKHFRAENITIAYNTLVNNTYGIEIGFDNNGSYGTEIENINIANNIVVGSTNNLINYVDGNTQGNAITWTNNLFYPTGTATLTSDGSTFASTEILTQDPNLTDDGTVWRATATTPTATSGISTLTVNDDIEGQTRPSTSNYGADHFSTEEAVNEPMTTDTVGPFAYEDDETPSETLFATSLATFVGSGEAQTSTITANVDWTATASDAWITVSPASGSNNGSIEITTTSNPTCNARSGSVVLTGGTLTINIAVSQDGGDPTTEFNLINTGDAADPVTVTASTEQTGNVATNTLDKDLGTRWSGEGVGAYITYDLGSLYDLDLVRIATTNNKTYYYEILTSEDGTTFTSVSDVESNSDGSYACYPVTNQARYVRIIGSGQINGSVWNTIIEIEFFGDESLAVEDIDSSSSFSIYPNPAKHLLKINNSEHAFNKVSVYNVEGRLMLSNTYDSPINTLDLNVSGLENGMYILNINSVNNKLTTQKIIINR